ncbi:MAG TPA: SCP2 sterol-binding domain-containing protein [Pseudonocardiaceae bacterium]
MADADINSIDPRKLSTTEFAQLLKPPASRSAQKQQDDIGAMDPRAFARLIKYASKRQLDAVLSDPALRCALLDRVFNRMADQFRPDKAPGRDSAIRWRITGGPGGDDVYETWISGARNPVAPHCTTSREPSHDPRVTFTLSGDQFLMLVSGNASPTMMFITGKVKLEGDLGFAANLTNIFDIPKA